MKKISGELRAFCADEDGVGVVEIILILVGICTIITDVFYVDCVVL